VDGHAGQYHCFFVLWLCFINFFFFKDTLNYKKILFKKECRIYLPFVSLVVGALVLILAITIGLQKFLQIGFNLLWNKSISLTNFPLIIY
jgi:hypothetical protein